MTDDRELLVLVFALFGGDGHVTERILHSVDVRTEVCTSVDMLIDSLAKGAGALVLAEEALVPASISRLREALSGQASWSDLPIIVSAAEAKGGRDGFGVLRALGQVANVSIIERPVRVRAMINAVENALRARRRQYTTRALLDALATSEGRFRSVQERAPYGLALYKPVLDDQGRVEDLECTFVNAAAEKVLKRRAEDVVGKRMSLFASRSSADARFSSYVTAFESGVQFTTEFFHREDGFDGAFRVTAFRLQNDLAIVFEDITERKQEEAQLARALTREHDARNEAEATNRGKDEFLATVSHELRTPLNAMLGWARMLSSEQLDPIQTKNALQAIERNAIAQAQLIEDLLDVSRIISGKMRLELAEVSLPAVVEAALSSIRPAVDAKQITLHSRVDSSASMVMGDPNRVQQVIWNLLSNAIKFTPRGGTVTITLARVESHVELTVTDTGQGFDPAFAPFLFQRFRQEDGGPARRHGGLGLGLAICRHLVELHGGTIEASSKGPGQGASFRVRIPVLTKPATTSAPPVLRSSLPPTSFEPPPELRGVKVLVVDDQADARALFLAVVSRCGALGMEAESAADAMEIITSKRPDVILSDIGMPDEDGHSFIRRVRALPADKGGLTPAAALTAYARAEDRIKAMNAGFEMHVTKPVEPSELVNVMKTLSRMGKALR